MEVTVQETRPGKSARFIKGVKRGPPIIRPGGSQSKRFSSQKVQKQMATPEPSLRRNSTARGERNGGKLKVSGEERKARPEQLTSVEELAYKFRKK